MKIQNEALFQQNLKNGINLFLGAGFSVAAKSKFGPLPVGDDLRIELLKRFMERETSNLSLPQVCQIISSKEKNALTSYFKERFQESEFDPIYKSLESINIKAIFTTNIDDLVFKIFSESHRYFVNDILLRGPSFASRSAIDYIPLRGCVLHAESNFDFSPIEIASSFERDKDKWFGYINRIQSTPTLYWGYRIEDAGVLQALAKETKNNRPTSESWIVLRKDDPETIEYYSSLGFQTIIADTLDLLAYLRSQHGSATPSVDKAALTEIFAEYAIPDIAQIPARPISEFYSGAEPSWFDIYSGKIHQTQHFLNAKNLLAQKNHLFLLGGPATGKSTLLKQLAVGVHNQGECLYLLDITAEKAELLVRDVNVHKQNVILFIDNAADSADSIQILIRSLFIKIVAAERD